jgi:hypothetical protein
MRDSAGAVWKKKGCIMKAARGIGALCALLGWAGLGHAGAQTLDAPPSLLSRPAAWQAQGDAAQDIADDWRLSLQSGWLPRLGSSGVMPSVPRLGARPADFALGIGMSHRFANQATLGGSIAATGFGRIATVEPLAPRMLSPAGFGMRNDPMQTIDEAAAPRQRIAWSAGLGAPLLGPWSGGLELSGLRQTGLPNSLQLLGSLSYAVNRRLVVDAYFARARSSGNGLDLFSSGVGTGLTYWFER